MYKYLVKIGFKGEEIDDYEDYKLKKQEGLDTISWLHDPTREQVEDLYDSGKMKIRPTSIGRDK